MRTIISLLVCLVFIIAPVTKAGEQGGYVLLQGAVGTGAGNPVNVQTWDIVTAFFVGTGISSGAQINLEARNSFGQWVPLHTQVLTTQTNAQVVQFLGPFESIGGNVVSHTDGSYNLSIYTIRNR